jgi:hypothetical protein
MHEVHIQERSVSFRSDLLRTVGLAALVLTALYLLYRIVIARSGTFPEVPLWWGIVYWAMSGLTLGATVYPAVRLSENTRDWRVGVLATVLASIGGWLGYALVITLISSLLGAREMTVVSGLTTQNVINTWLIGIPGSLIVGIVFGVMGGLLGVFRRKVRDH